MARSGRIGRVGHEVMHFGQKLMNTQRGVGRCACKSPTVKWANKMKVSSKKLHGNQTQPLTTLPGGALIQVGS